MQLAVAILAIALQITNCQNGQAILQPIHQCSFRWFQIQYNKSYNAIELAQREQIFMENCQAIQSHNANFNNKYLLALNQDADLSKKELQQSKGIYPLLQISSISQQNAKISKLTSINIINTTIIPTQIDYSSQGLMSQDSKVVDFCNSSWAIAAAYLYEYKLLTLSYRSYISEAAIISCTSFYAPHRRPSNCRGGYVQDALTMLGKVGAVKKSSYPSINYTFDANIMNTNGICVQTERIFVGRGQPRVLFNLTNSEIKQYLLQNGPLIVELHANQDFLRYSDGLFTACQIDKPSNLAVVLFGFKDEEYWLVRAPFGWEWGHQGTMKISMSTCRLGRSISFLSYQQAQRDVNVRLDPTIFFSGDPGNVRPGNNHGSFEPLASFILLVLLGLL